MHRWILMETAANTAGTQTNMVGSAMDFMVVFDVFIAVYLLYYAIKGSGKLFEGGDYPKEMREQHNQMLRKFCWIVGAPMLVLSILEYIYKSFWSTILIVYVLVCLTVYFILFQKRFRKYLRPEKAKKGKAK